MKILAFADKIRNLFINKLRAKQKIFSFRLFAFLVLLIALEIGLQMVRLLINFREPTSRDKKLALSIYKNKEWAGPLFEEYQKIKELEFDQYVGWKTREYHGEFINIGSTGVRKTFNPSPRIGGERDSIYVFGGSSIWGVGARDDHTIPSCLAKNLNQHGYHFIVANYGERGYTFTQGLMRLILLLKEGHRPRLAIFYDGVNEVSAAYHNGRAGIIGLAAEFQSLLKWKRHSYIEQMGSIVKDAAVHHSMIYRSVDKLIRLFQHNLSPSAARHYDEQELERLSRDIVTYYIASLHLVEKLSKAYDFQYICFWQPVIYTKNQLTEEEKSLDDQAKDGKLRQLYLDTYAAIKKLPLPHFYDLSEVLNNRNITLYSDFCHLSEEGNDIVANAIAEVIITKFLK
jgi:lysophospholipase L1-like esterase